METVPGISKKDVVPDTSESLEGRAFATAGEAALAVEAYLNNAPTTAEVFTKESIGTNLANLPHEGEGTYTVEVSRRITVGRMGDGFQVLSVREEAPTTNYEVETA